MRNFISMLNVVFAVLGTCLTALSLIFSHTLDAALPFAICMVWAPSAVMLFKSQRLWPWIASLVVVSYVTLHLAAIALRIIDLIQQAEHGDKSIAIDPSTTGIPLFIFSVMTTGAVCFLVALLFLPFLPATKTSSLSVP